MAWSLDDVEPDNLLDDELDGLAWKIFANHESLDWTEASHLVQYIVQLRQENSNLRDAIEDATNTASTLAYNLRNA